MNLLDTREFRAMTWNVQHRNGLSILVVEDHALIALDLETMLLDLGAGQVTIASTVDQALQLVATGLFDAAFLDVRLGESTCIPVAVALREKHVPIVIVTGYDAETEMPAEFATGLRVPKPFQEKHINDVWRALVDSIQAK